MRKWDLAHKDGSTARITQIEMGEFEVVRIANGIKATFKTGTQGALDVYQDLVDEGYQIKEGE